MPKLNATHIPERLREAIEQLERGEEVEARKNKSLLNVHQQKALDDAWAKQLILRDKHRPPKTKEDKQRIGWKSPREVRIEIFKQALQDADDKAIEDVKGLQRQREAKANRIYMDAWSKSVGEGKGGSQAVSAGNIALVRAGFGRPVPMVEPRDKEIRKLEQQILEKAEDSLNDEEREHLDWLREGKKPAKKIKKV